MMLTIAFKENNKLVILMLARTLKTNNRVKSIKILNNKVNLSKNQRLFKFKII